ncbi:unnamed protein product [Didymodactylos carnosus]|uniref:Uncharacterized protein n=1 Tax=Didymodactylos carnosus TaxID=1234261 RepID=A0A815NT44_9BILA|nr:unnamed protein product [Didymodactylos carnosus]CAF4315635.1 unnamed protein product [Didymodactylos carnosus]
MSRVHVQPTHQPMPYYQSAPLQQRGYPEPPQYNHPQSQWMSIPRSMQPGVPAGLNYLTELDWLAFIQDFSLSEIIVGGEYLV